MSVRVLMAAMALPATLPGCVVWEIRDEMRGANEHLTEVKQTLDAVNASLASANQALAETNIRLNEVETGLMRLDRTNALIDDVGQGLTRIDKTNVELERLTMLASIDQSLGRLDAHLASVRKTIGSIDSMIPFLDLGGDEEIIEPPAAEGAMEAEGAEASDSGTPGSAPGLDPGAAPGLDPSAGSSPARAAAAETGTAEGAPRPAQRRDSLLGVWVQRYPDSSIALVILSDGRYLRSTSVAGAGPVQEGRWAREGKEIIFTPVQPPAEHAAAAAAPAVPARAGTTATGSAAAQVSAAAATPGAAPAGPWRMSIVSSTMRTLGLRSESGAMAIFGRP